MATLDGSLGGAWAGVGREQMRMARHRPCPNWPQGPAGDDLHPQPALRVLPAVELLGARLARGHEILKPFATSPTSTATRTRCSTTRSARCARSACWRPRGRGPTRPRACHAHQAHGARRPRRPLRRRGLGQLISAATEGRQRVHDVAQGASSPTRRSRLGHRRQPQPDPAPRMADRPVTGRSRAAANGRMGRPTSDA